MISLKVKKLNFSAVMPKYSSTNAAGADLCALEECVIKPNTTEFVHTGIAMEIPENYVGLIYARSGMACKRGIAPANKVGVIDSDYRGEIIVALFNQSDQTQKIEAGERIAQIVITPYLTVDFEEVTELSETERASGGFGSTGRK